MRTWRSAAAAPTGELWKFVELAGKSVEIAWKPSLSKVELVPSSHRSTIMRTLDPVDLPTCLTSSNVPGLPDVHAPWNAVVETMYRERFGELCCLARRLVDTSHAAEEVVQEAFSRFAAVRTPPTPGKELAYLRSIVMNGARSTLRHRRVRERRGSLSIDVDIDVAAEEMLRRDDARRLRLAIARLPERQRQVIALRHFHDLSEREIADRLSISPGSVKTHSSRAIAAIRRLTLDGVA